MGNKNPLSHTQLIPKPKFINLQSNHITQKVLIQITLNQFHKLKNWKEKSHIFQKYVFKIKNITLIQTLFCQANIICEVQYDSCIALSQIKTVQNQTLYLLLCLLYGYGQIYEYFRCDFCITKDMIFINMKGQVKVWTSENIFDIKQIEKNQKDINAQRKLVKRVFSLIQQNESIYRLPNSLKNYKTTQLKQYTFCEAIIMIKNFARINNFRIPVRIQNLKRYLITNPNIILNRQIQDSIFSNQHLLTKQKPHLLLLQNSYTNYSKEDQIQCKQQQKQTTAKHLKSTLNQDYLIVEKSCQNDQSFKIHDPNFEHFEYSHINNSDQDRIMSFYIQT